MSKDDWEFRKIALEVITAGAAEKIRKAVMLGSHERGKEVSLEEYGENVEGLIKELRREIETLGYKIPPDLPENAMILVALAAATKDPSLVEQMLNALHITKEVPPEDWSAEG
jgi:hypothetical protein